MKAIVQTAYGSTDVLELREIDKPVVEDDEVLVRVHAASVHPDVWHVMSGHPYAVRLMGAGLLKPKNSVPGTDVAGHVEAVGKNVTRFSPGDEVFGESVRGHQWHNGGALAEYVPVPEDALALKHFRLAFRSPGRRGLPRRHIGLAGRGQGAGHPFRNNGQLHRCRQADELRAYLPQTGRCSAVIRCLAGGPGSAVGEVLTRDALYLRRRR